VKALTTGQVARQAGVGIETVRFYEREGLLDQPDRRPSGYRQYSGAFVARLRFIRRAKELGFTLKEIKDLLSLRLDPSTTCADIKRRSDDKIKDIEEKIRTLQRMKKALVKITKACFGQAKLSECPILDTLDPADCDDCKCTNRSAQQQA
jgi:MerR family mercuric resistance operon transcriptional regulator